MTILIAVPNPGAKADGSELMPYGAQAAIDAAKPGDTVMLRGEFSEPVRITKSYAAGAPLTIAKHRDGAVFDGKFQFPKPPAEVPYTAPDGKIAHWNPMVQITGAHVAWSGVDIKNSLGRGIGVSDTSDVELSDFSVDWSRNAGVHLHSVKRVICRNVKNFHSGCYYQKQRPASKKYNWPVAFNVLFSEDVLIDSCESSYSWGEGFALGRGALNSQIVNSVAANNMGIQIYLHRSAHCQAAGNLVYCDGSGFIANGIVCNNEDDFPNAPVINDLLIANNIAVNCAHSFAIWGNESSGVRSRGVRFLFNTSVNATEAALLIRTRGASAPEFVGNLFYQKQGQIVELAGGVPSGPDGIVFARNAWISPIAPPAAVLSPDDLIGVRLAKPNAAISYHAVDVANYRPLDASAVGVISQAPPTDHTGKPRTVWSVGALEYDGLPVEPDPPTEPPPEPPALTEERVRAIIRDEIRQAVERMLA